jgi:hypothetical protein
MKKLKINDNVRVVLTGITMLLLVTGCANQSFRMTGGSSLSPQGMQNLQLRFKYAPSLANKIPIYVRQEYEANFFGFNNDNAVRIVDNETTLTSGQTYYYLDAEIKKYKPGSPRGRSFIAPVFIFGLWGSYVNVLYSVKDPSTNAILGTGIVRKANLWGGLFIRRNITSETQLRACPEEILNDLNSFMTK